MENYGILLVEDEPAYHAIVSVLVAARGANVDWVTNGADAVEAARTRRYDLILMDIEMPGMDGFSATAAIRSQADAIGAVPILAFTTVSPARGEREFLDRGFDGWLAKPFSASTFHAALNAWLGRIVVDEERDGPEERLGRLLGGDAARSMIERFHAGLAEAVAAIDDGADAMPFGHRIGGLAGTLGYAALSAAWLGLQQDIGAWSTVRAMTVESLSSRAEAAGLARSRSDRHSS